MRTLFCCMLLLLVTVLCARVLDENRTRVRATADIAWADDTAASFVTFRAAAMAHVEAMTRAGRTAFIRGGDGAAARQIPADALADGLGDDFEMPSADGGEAAWEAWLALYTDGTGEDGAPAGDGFGAAGNRHAVLYVLSRLGTATDAALAVAVRELADRPAGTGLACPIEDADSTPCDSASYLGMGLPVATVDGTPVMDEGTLVSSVLYERAAYDGE